MIWNILEDRFQSALKELDFYHGSEHLWEVAHDLYPQSEQTSAWVQPLSYQLRHGQEAKVLETLESLPETVRNLGGVLSELVQREIKYFQNHRDHLHYQDNAAKGFPVGSGAVEQAARNFRIVSSAPASSGTRFHGPASSAQSSTQQWRLGGVVSSALAA